MMIHPVQTFEHALLVPEVAPSSEGDPDIAVKYQLEVWAVPDQGISIKSQYTSFRYQVSCCSYRTDEWRDV